jgi:hypothetical protein
LFDTFIEAGGIPAVVRVVRVSSSSTSQYHTVALIKELVFNADRPGRLDRSQELGAKFYEAGMWSLAFLSQQG